jgi:DNA-binding SARP family transcriptional activator
MLELRFRLLGSFELTATEPQRVAPLEGRKAQELISFLLLVPGQAKARDVAVEALWPGARPETGRKQIRQALWHIHRAVDRDPADTERLVIADTDHLAVNQDRMFWCDAVEFAKAVERLESGIPEDHDNELVERALDLYRGPLLDGCYAEWCLVERERLEGLYLSALDDASMKAEARLDFEAAAQWASTLLRIDPAHERSHRRLMRFYYAMDDRTRALRQFERCCQALESELGVRPSGRTDTLAAAIRVDVEPPNPREQVTVLPPRSERPAVVRELAALRRAVDELRRSVLDRLA